jgi:hypothetical protein
VISNAPPGWGDKLSVTTCHPIPRVFSHVAPVLEERAGSAATHGQLSAGHVLCNENSRATHGSPKQLTRGKWQQEAERMAGQAAAHTPSFISQGLALSADNLSHLAAPLLKMSTATTLFDTGSVHNCGASLHKDIQVHMVDNVIIRVARMHTSQHRGG